METQNENLAAALNDLNETNEVNKLFNNVLYLCVYHLIRYCVLRNKSWTLEL